MLKNKEMDFFFGEIRYLNGTCRLSLHRTIALCERFDKNFVTQQFNRLLKKMDGNIILSDGTSHPNFDELLNCINTRSIGGIYIEQETTVNDNVKATLSCSLFLAEGIIKVLPHWCAYKQIRADEIITTLLCPLHRENLEAITYLKVTDGEGHKYKKLVHGDDYSREIKDVLELSGYPYFPHPKDQSDDQLNEYVRILRESDNQGMINNL